MQGNSESLIFVFILIESGLSAMTVSILAVIMTRIYANSFLTDMLCFLANRSSIHGRGMNRFWTCVQGYAGLILFLVSAHTTGEASTGTTDGQVFTLGALIPGGLSNKESFYGASGSCVFSLDPVFLPLHSTGIVINPIVARKTVATTTL